MSSDFRESLVDGLNCHPFVTQFVTGALLQRAEKRRQHEQEACVAIS
jgi:hypothetical protein